MNEATFPNDLNKAGLFCTLSTGVAAIGRITGQLILGDEPPNWSSRYGKSSTLGILSGKCYEKFI